MRLFYHLMQPQAVSLQYFFAYANYSKFLALSNYEKKFFEVVVWIQCPVKLVPTVIASTES